MNQWWHGAIVYQVYPHSFMDSGKSGIGSLKGIVEKLDYIQSLHVDAIWLSPIFKSPMFDFGYDISDYRMISPIYGTMEDCDQLIKSCKERNIKVIFDLVINHTSVEHPWFQESRRSRTSARADWYVWADSKPDGTAPNNWLSFFGGPAWTWESRRNQYYLHDFLRAQPKLNLRHPEVREAVLNECRFWIEKGVDGFRLDACNFYYCDQELRDNPPRPKDAPGIKGVPDSNPYGMQYHVYDKSQPDNVSFLRELRSVVDSYDSRPILVAEVLDDNNREIVEQYIEPSGPLHSAYSFEFLGDDFSVPHFKEVIDSLIRRQWPIWTFGNHDVPRLASRWSIPYSEDDFVKQIYCLLVCLRGVAFIYQGDELGLPQADLALCDLKDPYGIEFYPEYKGRDGCRTPMPWHSEQRLAGFSHGDKAWLPIPQEHIGRSVNLQSSQTNSVLNYVRNCLKLRKDLPVLRFGTTQVLPSSKDVLIFSRIHKNEVIICALNFSNEDQVWDLHEITRTTKEDPNFSEVDFSKLTPVESVSRLYEIKNHCIVCKPGGSVILTGSQKW